MDRYRLAYASCSHPLFTVSCEQFLSLFSGFLILTICKAADKILENLTLSTLTVTGPRKSLGAYQQL